MEKIALGFRRMGIVLLVRHFGEMKINNKIFVSISESCQKMCLFSATGPIEHYAVSVSRSGGYSTDRHTVCGGEIDRISYREYRQVKQYEYCVCAACLETFINKMELGLGLGLCH